MSRRRLTSVWLLCVVIAVFSLVAWGKVTLVTGGSGEAVWTDQDTCSTGEAVEITTFFDGDWAGATLDCAGRGAAVGKLDHLKC